MTSVGQFLGLLRLAKLKKNLKGGGGLRGRTPQQSRELSDKNHTSEFTVAALGMQ